MYAKEVGFDIRSERGLDSNWKTTKKKIEFATDSEISSAFGQTKERELQKWVPDENIPQDLQWEDDQYAHWDQFATNRFHWFYFSPIREKFGVETTWDENLYTTEIKPEDVKKLGKKANQLAKEIERVFLFILF